VDPNTHTAIPNTISNYKIYDSSIVNGTTTNGIDMAKVNPTGAKMNTTGSLGFYVSSSGQYAYALLGSNMIYSYIVNCDGTLTPNGSPLPTPSTSNTNANSYKYATKYEYSSER